MRRERLICAAVVAVLLGQMAAAMLISARDDAPTYDEPSHTAAAVAYVRLHDLDWNPEHPPVAKLVAGISFLLARPHIPQDSPEFTSFNDVGFGQQLLYNAGNDAAHVMWLARLPMMILALLLALAVFGFSTDLFGWRGGLVSLAAVTLCPNVIAHGRLVHTDVPVAFFFLLTAWMLWRAAYRHPWWLAPAGVSFGLALGSKFTALFALIPCLAVAFLGGFMFRSGDRGTSRRLLAGAARGALFTVLSVAVLWGTYLAVDTHLRFVRPEPRAESAYGPLATLADHLPVPTAYRVGLRYVIWYDETGPRPGFLNGSLYSGGRLIFYPAVLVMKTPLGLLALWLGALALLARSRRRWEFGAFVLLAPFTLLAFAVFSSTNRGIRHVIYVPVFLAVAAGAFATLRLTASRGRMVAAGVLVALAGAAASAWLAFPSYLAYTNEAFGGIPSAPERFADSNVDWGQDLRRLAAYVRDRYPDEKVTVFYFGTAKLIPSEAPNIEVLMAPVPTVKGLVALSATYRNVYPDSYRWIPSQGRLISLIGGSILLYRV